MSVVVPFHDQHDTLPDALASLRGQAELREVIIVDDASLSPLTPEPTRGPPLIVLKHDRNAGPAAARNRGVAAASGEFVAFLDADDLWLPDKTRLQLDALTAAGEQTHGCLSGYYIIRRPGGPKIAVAPPDFSDGGRRAFLSGWIGAAGSTLMMRREAFLAHGGYDEGLRHYEDWDLLLRASRTGRMVMADQPLSVTLQPPSAPGPLQGQALERLAAKHRAAARPAWQQRHLEAALAYERASMDFGNRRLIACLRSLARAAARRPWHTSRRAGRRLLAGMP